MHITVKLFATLRDNRFKIREKEYAERATVLDVLQDLMIDRHSVSLIFINGRMGNAESILEDKDTLALFPPVGGG